MLWIKVLLVFVLILNVYVNGLPWREEPQVLPSDPITSDKDTPPSVNFEARGHSIHESSTETPPETVHPMDTTETTGDTFPTRGPHKWRPRTTKEHEKPGKSSQGGKGMSCHVLTTLSLSCNDLHWIQIQTRAHQKYYTI